MAKQSRGEATVERLLTAALEVFATSGQAGFTVQAVTRASGVSLGSLYHHFGSFDGLAAALYSHCLQQTYTASLGALGRARTARTGIRAFVTTYLRFIQDNPAVARYLHGSAYSSYLAVDADRARGVQPDHFPRVSDHLIRWTETGDIAPLPGPLLEVLLIGPVAVAAHRWLATPEDIDLNQAARVLSDRIWASVRAE
ncbi:MULTISPECIES: TetR/AcrR family transcriptional regulator [Streptomyces]|uniref:Transcriptional regulator, TetR family n=2 Tax=Bacteria TaxID=2 RepID=F2R314_STRVP|nr:TetR/AcrR family transcriptional regulator [Streptomyces venezuelae]APE26000.1 TetR family transcriptional regulator [Streptomyces venezuelae]QES03337.1 TetR/AcrR family transcriptional regulator [Streptomyces venezuelae ATCC 10712]CCA60713.1 Transcriptional regulator, TetR family [Streptomyces venezuelae ATCC 10712]